MISTEDYSALLLDLYAAPLQPSKWQAFFHQLSQLTEVSCGYVMTGGKNQDFQILAGGGFSFNTEVLRLYAEYYGQLDSFVPPFLRNPRVTVIRGEELVPQDELRQTEFYCDLLSKFDMEHMTLMSCTSTAGHKDVMALWRRSQDGPMDETAVSLLTGLLPHARVALQMRARLESAELRAYFNESALDAMSIPALLVSVTGRVQHMNGLASAVIHKSDGLRLERGKLKAVDPTQSEALKAIISTAASAGKPSAGITMAKFAPGGALRIDRLGQQNPLHVVVLPIPEDHKSIFGLPSALVIVSDPCAPSKSRSTFLQTLYGLTPTESRLADLLLEGLEVREIASRLKMTLETARFHLKRVLTKTGTHRQTELMRLLLSLPGVV